MSWPISLEVIDQQGQMRWLTLKTDRAGIIGHSPTPRECGDVSEKSASWPSKGITHSSADVSRSHRGYVLPASWHDPVGEVPEYRCPTTFWG
jgi:hypothetical protein